MDLSIGDSTTYRMTITKDGYVGINTTSPTSMFQVYKLRSSANEEPTLFNINVSGYINTGKDLSRIAFTEGTSTISIDVIFLPIIMVELQQRIVVMV